MKSKIDYKVKLQELQLQEEELNKRETELNIREEKLNEERIILDEEQSQLKSDINFIAEEKDHFLQLNEGLETWKHTLIDLCQEIRSDYNLDEGESEEEIDARRCFLM